MRPPRAPGFESHKLLHPLSRRARDCAEFDVANAHDVDCYRSYWGTKGYEYANYTRGACPAVFNRTTTNESVCGFAVWIVSKDIP